MKKINTYIIEKLKLNKDIKVDPKVRKEFDTKWTDRACSLGIKFLRSYINDIDEWKYYINVNRNSPDGLVISFDFVYSLPPVKQYLKDMNEKIKEIKWEGEQIFYGIETIAQSIILFLEDEDDR